MSLLMDALRKAEQEKQKAAATQGRNVAISAESKFELEPMLRPIPDGLPSQQTEVSAPAAPSLPTTDTQIKARKFEEAAVPGMAGSPQRKGVGSLPELPTRLEDLDEQFITHATEIKQAPTVTQTSHATQSRVATDQPAPRLAAANAEETGRFPSQISSTAAEKKETTATQEAARNIFEAKQPQKNRRGVMLAIGIIGLVGVIGIGGYFWWQMQPKSGLLAGGQAGRPAPVASASQPGPKTESPPTISAKPTDSATTPPTPTPAAPPVAVPPAPTLALASSTPAERAPLPIIKPPPVQDNDDETPVRQTPKPARSAQTAVPPAGTRSDSPVRVSTASQKVDPALEQAYEAFHKGEFNLAQAAWQHALQSDPRNIDALRGLAAVAQQRGQTDRAADLYLRVLEVDPRDALAVSGLISLNNQVDTQQTESRLKTLLADQPESPFLNFALGNLYARGMRWADAQQVYFKAYTADPGNPDYLFNLAVSLDQLRQIPLAVRYYNLAIGAAAQRPAGFDVVQAAARLKMLQP